jgi:benzoyl-CoA-dihydrodiol lyase
VLQELAAQSDRPATDQGVLLSALEKSIVEDAIRYEYVTVQIERATRCATLVVQGPSGACPHDVDNAVREGSDFWPLAVMRQLDDALLELRFNEPEIGTLFFKTAGDTERVRVYDDFLEANAAHWFVREINLLGQRVFKRLDLTSRSLFALIEPGSCFCGFLLEITFAADRSFMLEGQFAERGNEPPATIALSAGNFGRYRMVNDLTRLEARFWGEPETLEDARCLIGRKLDGRAAQEAGLVTVAMDDIDWEDEIRILAEERAGFSPDALTGMEANLRFPGPETMESKIFARLTAWQNWIFQRPNAVGTQGALPLYGTGQRPNFDKTRV